MNCIVVQHLAFEDLGVFAPVLAERGWTVDYRQAGCDAVSREEWLACDLAVLLGGPIGVGDVALYPFLREELALTQARMAADKPLLGVCLGAQLMAAAAGAHVHAGTAKEIGWGALTLSAAGMASPLAALRGAPVLHWHGDTFTLPEGAELLASSPVTPHQAFRMGPRQLALQFHAEADAARMERWLIGHTCELHSAGVDIPALRAASHKQGPAARAAGTAFFRRWLEGLNA